MTRPMIETIKWGLIFTGLAVTFVTAMGAGAVFLKWLEKAVG